MTKELIEATQEDRNLHRDIFGFDGGSTPDRHTALRLEAIARHRQSSTAALRDEVIEECARVAELQGSINRMVPHIEGESLAKTMRRSIVAAIRNLKQGQKP